MSTQQVVTPLRIKCLTLTDFRAFPGPTPVNFELNGKNLLVYGENGAGKSSIFHALRNFFSLKPEKLLDHKNVFSNQSQANCGVSVEFSDASSPVTWTTNGHPCSVPPGPADTRVTQAALRCACLDYRALLETNYKQGQGEVNLFEIAINHLLHDYPAMDRGTLSTLGELWNKAQSHLSNLQKNRSSKILEDRITEACRTFNSSFINDAVPKLIPLINDLMDHFGWKDVELKSFQAPGLTYNQATKKTDRVIAGQELTPQLTFRGHSLLRPQFFLNEARLSAFALAIYLAGRLACTPTAIASDLKLLVLDDVLIGLDHSNRLPVLDVLKTRFSDWQIVLLTHDRNWFDLARSHLPKDDWNCIEIYEGDAQAIAPIPIVYPTCNRAPRALLEKANELIQTQYVEAAANYARQAFELGVRKVCELKKIEMRYCIDQKEHQTQDFIDKIKQWIKGIPDKKNRQEWEKAVAQLEILKNVVMNPYSHPSAPNIPKQEVEQAIEAVKKFLDLSRKKP